MTDYSTLKEMGIHSFEDVSHFKVRREQQADVLKVYYRRTKGSLLPKSKKFTFVRPRSAVPLQYRDQQGWKGFKDSSPRLHKAIDELTQLTQPETTQPLDQKAQFLSDLNHLEKVMYDKISEIRRQIEALD
ncbi:MAG: DUF3461 family protein [Motiliproteus sp.]